MIYTTFHKHKGRYGYRRITLELRNEGCLINHKTVKKLMDELELKSEVRKVRYHSYKGEVGKTAPNIIDRDFAADRPYQKLATDVTQVTIEGRKTSHQYSTCVTVKSLHIQSHKCPTWKWYSVCSTRCTSI